jgi:predicted nucleic acid-binding protein
MAACVFDSSLMLLVTDDVAAVPAAPTPIDDPGAEARERLNFLIETLDDQRIDVVVPTPVLTELLVSARRDAGDTLKVLNGLARLRVEGFGQRAAIECAEMLRRVPHGSGRRSKVKFDHQIVAIAKVVGATIVYSDDNDVKVLCEREGIDRKGVWDLPARPVDAQRKLDL